MMSPATAALPSDREIVITRRFNAPREIVFEAWTRPEHIRHWWDPSRRPLAHCDIDLRIGGAFRFVNAGQSEGQSFAGTYIEIDPPALLVFTTPSPSGGESVGTLKFSTRGPETALTVTIKCPTKADRDALLSMRVDAGTSRSLDNLAEYLGTLRRKG